MLSSGGHIAGIVNPPSPKAWYLTGDEYPDDPEQWRAGAERHAGSWWEDWADWSARSGPATLVDPPPMGSEKHPVLGDGARRIRPNLRTERTEMTDMPGADAAAKMSAASDEAVEADP